MARFWADTLNVQVPLPLLTWLYAPHHKGGSVEQLEWYWVLTTWRIVARPGHKRLIIIAWGHSKSKAITPYIGRLPAAASVGAKLSRSTRSQAINIHRKGNLASWALFSSQAIIPCYERNIGSRWIKVIFKSFQNIIVFISYIFESGIRIIVFISDFQQIRLICLLTPWNTLSYSTVVVRASGLPTFRVVESGKIPLVA